MDLLQCTDHQRCCLSSFLLSPGFLLHSYLPLSTSHIFHLLGRLLLLSDSRFSAHFLLSPSFFPTSYFSLCVPQHPVLHSCVIHYITSALGSSLHAELVNSWCSQGIVVTFSGLKLQREPHLNPFVVYYLSKHRPGAARKCEYLCYSGHKCVYTVTLHSHAFLLGTSTNAV